MKKMNHQNLILFGHKSSGKSFFGRLLAKELGFNFLDIDTLIEDLYIQDFPDKYNCREIFLKHGEEAFRKLESLAVDRLQNLEHTILALGGGTLLNPKNCMKLQSLGKLIYLDASKEKIKQRIFKRGVPSFLDSNDPDKSFEIMFQERKLVYQKVSSYQIKLKGKSREQIVEALKSFL